MGIEPTLVAWEATVLPLNYTRLGPHSIGHARKTATSPARRTAATPRRTGTASLDGIYGTICPFGRPASRHSFPEKQK